MIPILIVRRMITVFYPFIIYDTYFPIDSSVNNYILKLVGGTGMMVSLKKFYLMIKRNLSYELFHKLFQGYLKI